MSTPLPRASIERVMPTICPGVLPLPKMTSGTPCRRARWWSTFA